MTGRACYGTFTGTCATKGSDNSLRRRIQVTFQVYVMFMRKGEDIIALISLDRFD
jgi:hypothetical protein